MRKRITTGIRSKIHRLVLYSLAITLSASCGEKFHEEEFASNEIEEDSVTGEIILCTGIEDSPIIETRSILPEESIETMITGITIAAYDSEGLIADCRHYTSGFSGMALTVNKSEIYDIFALVNMGDMTSSMPLDKSGLQAIAHTISSYAEVCTSGIPMSGKLENVSYGTSRKTIPVERLLAKLCVRILHTGLNQTGNNSTFVYNMCNKSMYVRQANSRLFPFSAQGSRAASVSDTMEESDYNADLNSRTDYKGSLSSSQLGPGPGYFQDTTIVFYIPENVQGILLPGNSDPYSKTPENISGINGKDYSGICTFLEFAARRENTGIGYGGDLTYRYYLGSDSTTDFSIERNCRYDLTLNFSERGFLMESWKVTRGDNWKDTRVLEFLDKPYTIYKGETRKVMVHYHTATTTAASSMAKPDDWSYIFDNEAMTEAGLTYTFDRNTLVEGPNGYKDFCFFFTASESAKAGSSFPIRIESWDGNLVDYSTIYISELGDMDATWDFCPMYVSQEGTVTITGIPEDRMPIVFSTSSPSIISCTRQTGNTFKIVATGAGETQLTFTNKDGSQELSLAMTIKAPQISIASGYLSANPDGTPVKTGYCYVDNTGKPIDNINQAAFNTYLKPVVADNEFFSTAPGSNEIELYVNRLYGSNGTEIATGTSHSLTISAVQCPEVVPVSLSIYVIDPYAGITTRHYGRIDDYTLLSLSSVHSSVKEYFVDNIASNSFFSHEAPVPNADPGCVSAELTPLWLNTFSYKNEVFAIEYNHESNLYSSGAAFEISQNNVTSATRHGAGTHNINLLVQNIHSSEYLSQTVGTVDIYVHSAIGASAAISSKAGSYKPAGGTATFASVYNSPTANPPFSDANSYIYYMDVSVEHLMDISGVYVFDRMATGINSRQNIFDCLDIVRPSATDKSSVQGCLLISIYDNLGGDRVTIGGEAYGYRRGIGKMLYRAILYPGRSSSLTATSLKETMLGYNPSGANKSTFGPLYNVHDMNKGSVMTQNIVPRTAPYYFSPSSCTQYRDSQGKGYHVIHFLDHIVPDSCGWINLL